MKQRDKQRRDVEVLRERTSSLTSAILRISASLDVGTVLREVVDSALALTHARYGIITTIDEAGQPDEFVTSGFTREEQQLLLGWPPALRFFEHLRKLPGPLRLADLPAYIRSMGFAPGMELAKTFQVTPMRHRGVQVGTFFLGAKEGGNEFTDEDEEILVLFASQAATAIANARTHSDERRARADLEALVETSPVGVTVFDARTGSIVSSNREARRIVEGLRTPGQPPEQLLEVVTCRFSNGREVALTDFPMKQVISDAVTVRAEEVVLSVPDGRRVTILVNATPIHSAAGAVESMVVTMQDMAPLEELDRLRTEFLGMVSHELRTPLAAIKGSTATLLGASRAFDPAEVRQFFRIIDTQADHMDTLIRDLLDAGRIDSGTLSVDPKPADVAALVDQARTTFLSGGGKQTIRIDLPPDLPRVLVDERRIVQVLNNLFSNASRHSHESTAIHVDAASDGVYVSMSITDEGQGVPPEQLPYLFRKYADIGDSDSSRRFRGVGLGLAICKGLVESHGGRIRAESGGLEQGTRITFTVPVAEGVDGTAGGFAQNRSHSLREGRKRGRILVVDDDPQMLRYVRDALSEAGYSPLTTGDPEEVSRLITAEKPRLVLLDLLLPGSDGIELMERNPDLANLPVIFISAYGRDETIARALKSGATDYIVKPFSPTELVARVHAALRRRADPEPFLLGDLAINYERRRVTVVGRPVQLTATEYELLRALSVNAGRVSTHDSLLRQAWGEGADDPNLVRTFVKKLRRKLGDDAARPTYIRTERGVGYRMPAPADL